MKTPPLTPFTPTFERDIRIRFSHCDPAGIVFFPQYLTMFNDLVEDWVTEGLDISYADLLGVRRVGLPTVNLLCNFSAVSRMGDDVTLGLALLRLGTSSLDLALNCRSAEQSRVQVRQVLVCTNLDNHRAIPLPADLRAALTPFTPRSPQ